MPDEPSKRKRILLIDDEEDYCAIVKANIEDSGPYNVVTLSDPEKAEETIEREQPHLILLDNVMPKRNGSEIVKALKVKPETRRIPIIMLSGKGEMVFDKDKETYRWEPNTPLIKHRGEKTSAIGPGELARTYNVNLYLAKPFSTEILIEKIKMILTEVIQKKIGEEEDALG